MVRIIKSEQRASGCRKNQLVSRQSELDWNREQLCRPKGYREGEGFRPIGMNGAIEQRYNDHLWFEMFSQPSKPLVLLKAETLFISEHRTYSFAETA